MINIFKNIKGCKSHYDKDSYEEFSRVYLDSTKKESEIFKKACFFNPKYFARKNFRIVILEQIGTANSVQYDSQSTNPKEISSPTNNPDNFFNVNVNKELFDTIFGLPSTGSLHRFKIHFLKQENQIVFTLIYPNYAQILKRIRSLSHSPSLSRSSSLGDYISLNNNIPINEMAINNQKKVAICVSWCCNLDDQAHLDLFFRYVLHFLQLFTGLAEKIAQIHQDHGSFLPDKMVKARLGFVDCLHSLFTSPRLILPVWLSFSAMSRYTWFRAAQNLRSMKKAFLEICLSHLLSKYHNKEKGFFLARIVTVVLIYHQGWIHSVSPSVHRRHLRNFSCQPGICRMAGVGENAICGQLAGVILGCGGLSLSRTIIAGSNQAQVNLLLYFVSFWLRCSPLSVRHEDALDPTMLCEPKKTTSRRKSASCNDPTDSGIASQEDISRLLCAREGYRGSNSSSIHRVGIRNSSTSSLHFKSSASTGSSPVRDYNELQSKNITIDQMIAVDLAVEEFVYSRQYQTKPAEIKKFKVKKENYTSIQDTKILLSELPLLYSGNIKEEEDILYKSIAHFNIGGYVDHVVPGIALQGTSDCNIPNPVFLEDMRSWMKHAFWMYPSQRHSELDWNFVDFTESVTDRPSSATAIILNSDKASVTICTVSPDKISGDYSRDIINSSPIILSLFDQLQTLLRDHVDPELVFDFLEMGLIHLHALSVSLATFIRDCRIFRDPNIEMSNINKLVSAEAIGCHADDIPLLYSTALAHSPDIYGLENELLY